jgi:hypothetical protein
LVQDKDIHNIVENIDLSQGEDFPPLRINGSYIEHIIVMLFHIDVVQLIRIKATLAKEMHIQPSEVDSMAYWEYEIWLGEIQNQVKEQNDSQEKEMKQYNIDQYKNPSKMMPKTPSFGSVNMNIPKI